MKRIILLCFCFLLLGSAPQIAFASPELNIDTTSPFVYPEYSKKLSMDFQEARLVDVLKIFSEQTRYNLITSQTLSNKRVTVYLDNVPVEQALEQVLRANDLTYELQPNSDIYIVKPLEKPDDALITRVYQLKYATVTTSKLNNTLAIKVEGGGNISQSANTDTSGIVAAIKDILTNKGKIVEDARTNSVIVTDIHPNFPLIEKTIARLDIPVPQILIEVEMLEVSKTNADTIGIKFGDTPLTFTGAKRNHLYPWDQNKVQNKGFTFDEEYIVGTIDASGLAATLQFLKSQSDTKTLARPRILTLNNEPAQIKISTDEAIGSKTTTQSSQATATSSVEAERVETGVFLTVTPQANLLTSEILMAVVPKVIVAATGITIGNTTFKDPEERSAQSLLVVHSGDTVIIGGLLREETTNTLTKVPILGDIPLVGQAFRHTNKSVKDRELIIFITPHIIKQEPRMQESQTALVNKNQHTDSLRIREQDAPAPMPGYYSNDMAVLNKREL